MPPESRRTQKLPRWNGRCCERPLPRDSSARTKKKTRAKKLCGMEAAWRGLGRDSPGALFFHVIRGEEVVVEMGTYTYTYTYTYTSIDPCGESFLPPPSYSAVGRVVSARGIREWCSTVSIVSWLRLAPTTRWRQAVLVYGIELYGKCGCLQAGC